MTFEYEQRAQASETKIAEAAVVHYDAGRRNDDVVISTISSKNQITLPAHLLREIGIGPGDRLAVTMEGNRLILRPRPKDWVKHLGGSLKAVYGQDAEEIDAYIAEMRRESDREVTGR